MKTRSERRPSYPNRKGRDAAALLSVRDWTQASKSTAADVCPLRLASQRGFGSLTLNHRTGGHECLPIVLCRPELECGRLRSVSVVNTMGHDIFISHSSRDKTTADAVCAGLEARNLRCWIAPRDVHPGIEYGKHLVDALDHCRVLVLVFSAASNDSPHVGRELEIAIKRKMPVIPFRIEAVPPSGALEYFLSSIQWLDALTPRWNST